MILHQHNHGDVYNQEINDNHGTMYLGRTGHAPSSFNDAEYTDYEETGDVDVNLNHDVNRYHIPINQRPSGINSRQSRFYDLISRAYDPDIIIDRLHALIDGKKGVKAFVNLKVAFDAGYFSSRPTFRDVKTEFGFDVGFSSAYYSVMGREIDREICKNIIDFLKKS